MAYMNKEMAANIRKAIKEKYPNYKFSVAMTMPGYISVAVMSSDLFEGVGHISANKGNFYSVDRNSTKEEESFLGGLIALIKEVGGWYSNSDTMRDYFDVAFGIELSVGKYNVPHEFKA